MKYFIVQSINLPFEREWSIYGNFIFNDKEILKETIRKDLEEEVLLEPVYITEENEWLIVNGDKDKKWLKILELSAVFS